MNPDLEADLANQVQSATQQALDATASAYALDAGIDVEARLLDELSTRGVVIEDAAWLSEAATSLRSGHPIEVVEPDRPGSMGGDNGGG